ncbi:PREDICTED: uncharacterized protein LOC108747588 [Trachymyrmex septentrionalis]|uniref:uncharacterized protein LOC108747588 n=1 Tax=Trachymyrmex septentrionalis TaxID=34720 RepID=UPI00084F3368|nr:PREDICTED: uncharacterized protein LOC108747588 [Trachymyrmex septentrionalis]
MEVDSVKEMFSRSEENFGVKYSNYIGDGDSATFKAILDFLLPIYENLSREDLLERCLGGHTQNANESFNSTIWRLTPKHLHSGQKIIELLACIAAGVFNEGYNSILRLMNQLDIVVGNQALNFAKNTDEARVTRQNRMSQSETKAARTARKQQQLEDNQLFEEAEELLYAPGIAD